MLNLKLILFSLLLLFFTGCSGTYTIPDESISYKVMNFTNSSIAFINDTETSLNYTWSSSKIQNEINNINLTNFVNGSNLTNNYIPVASTNNTLIDSNIFYNDSTITIDYIKSNNILLDTYLSYNLNGDLSSMTKIYSNNYNITYTYIYNLNGDLSSMTRTFKNQTKTSTFNYAVDNSTINSIIIT